METTTQEIQRQEALQYEDVEIQKIIVHKVGNRLREEPLYISKKVLSTAEEPTLKKVLLKYFLSSFKTTDFYKFHHESELELNEIFQYASRIFTDPDNFYLQSINIAKHLHEKSIHPIVKEGELYIVYFEQLVLGNEMANAIGIFKSENKDTFLKIIQHPETLELQQEDGINIQKLDKGCLIFDIDRENGFKICIVDTVNKSNEAQYWKDDFLKVKSREDYHYHTKNYINLCQNFVKDKFREEFEVSKVDEIDFVNRSMDYFKKKEVFDINNFAEEVIQQPEIVDAFKDYRKTFQENHDFTMYDEFDISPSVVKNSSKVYKSILKLDKNFHIYIHGNKEYIEKGFDEEKGMSYYKVYFKNEQ